MTKLKSAAICALGVIVPSLLAHTAIAMTWTGQDMNPDSADGPEQLYTATSDNSALAFVCSDGKLTSAIAVDSNDGANILKNMLQSKRNKTVRVTLSVNGQEVNTSNWIYSSSRKIFIPRKRIVTVKIYNAAVKGDTVSFKRQRKDAVDLTLPETNANFVNFGGACGIGANKAMKTKMKAEQKVVKPEPKKVKPPSF